VKTLRLLQLLALIPLLAVGQVAAEEIQVAVASNFSETMNHIASRFETETGHKVTLIVGSTGKHYAQIKNGAPFDLFFAADTQRPELLEKEGIAISGSRFTYAKGRLLLWSPKREFIDTEGKMLEQGKFRYLSIANERLAPYGKAAAEVLQTLGLWDALHGRIVRGENIGQAFQFVKSGNAELGLVAYSQLKRPNQPIDGSYWDVPQSLYSPIEQQAVLLKQSVAAHAFLEFSKSDRSLAIIHGFGYITP